METDEGEGRDPLFRYDEPIFENEELLKIKHVPGADRIVGRDKEMKKVGDALNPAIFGREPNHLFIFGKTGTGKSLISRSVTERVIAEAGREDVAVKSVFVDCGEENTEASVVKTIAKALNDPESSGTRVPDRGLSTGDYYKRLWRAVDLCTDVAIIILDEIDMLDDDEVLRKLSRAGESQKIQQSDIGVIGITNKIDFPDNLNERVKSSFTRDELVFQPYDANQLREILENRRDAFKDDVLSNDVIPLVAAFAAQEHGDARKGIDILRNAGRIATKEDADTVVEDHVRAAKRKTEVDRFAEVVDGAPVQAKVILFALTSLTDARHEDQFTTKQIYDRYRGFAGELDLDTLSERRVQEILKEQNFLNVIQSDKKGLGRGEGVAAYHRLMEDSEIVREVLLRDSRIDEMA